MVRIEDGQTGSVDCWWMPRFDSPASLAAVLGFPDQGRWLLTPATEPVGLERSYLASSVMLETTFITGQRPVRVTDAPTVRVPRPQDAGGKRRAPG